MYGSAKEEERGGMFMQDHIMDDAKGKVLLDKDPLEFSAVYSLEYSDRRQSRGLAFILLLTSAILFLHCPTTSLESVAISGTLVSGAGQRGQLGGV